MEEKDIKSFEEIQKELQNADALGSVENSKLNMDGFVAVDLKQETKEKNDELMEMQQQHKKKKKSKFPVVLLAVIVVIIVLIALAVLIFTVFSKSNESKQSKYYDFFDSDLFLTDDLNGGVIKVNDMVSKTVLFDISLVPSEYRDATIEALKTLEEELVIFEIKCIDYDYYDDIDILPYTEEEHNSQGGGGYVGWCEHLSKDYNFITHKYAIDNCSIKIDYYKYDEYSNTQLDGVYEDMVKRITNVDYLYNDGKTALDDQIRAVQKSLKNKINAKTFDVNDSEIETLVALLKDKVDNKGFSADNEENGEYLYQDLKTLYYKNTDAGRIIRYKSTVMHEAIHALLFADDIESDKKRLYENAESIMTYNPENRTYGISDFDRENIIKPGVVTVLLRNERLVKDLNYDMSKIEAYAEEMVNDYSKKTAA